MKQDKQEISGAIANKSDCCPDPVAIAIDGPAGAGKSTVARLLAQRIGFCHIDTGAMYRAITLAALRRKIDLDDERLVAQLTDQLTLTVQPDPEAMRIILDGEDITEAIRDQRVSTEVSRVAKLASIRSRLVQWQRQLAQQQRVVMDGRDIGTHVLPNAPLKVFLTASLAERGRRRMQELAAKGIQISEEQMQSEIERRDRIDSQRETSPLMKAPDAVEIDTSSMSVEEVVSQIIRLARMRGITAAKEIKSPTGE